MNYKQVTAMPDLSFSAVGFGCWGISGAWNDTDDRRSIDAIQRAVELGINFFDVAPVYGLGHAESILGRAIKKFNREDIIIASKCGLIWDDQQQVTVNLTPESLFQEIEDSLGRLQTDTIDIYQIHWPDPQTPIAETMAALETIRAAGKINYIGVSNFSLDLTKEALNAGRIASHQGLYNLLERNPDSYHNIPLSYRTAAEILPFCREKGLAFFPYSPIFQGLLTDEFRPGDNFDEMDVRMENPKLVGETFQRYFEISTKLRHFAREIGRPLSQIAINWLINQPAVTSIISGAQTIAHVEQNAGAVSWVLTADMEARIEEILEPYKNEGLIQ